MKIHAENPKERNLLKQIYAEARKIEESQRQNANFKLIFKFLFYLSTAIFCYYHILTQPNFYLLCVSFILYGIITMLIAFNFAHDLSHNTIFKNNELNNFGFTTLFVMMGAHAQAWKTRHIYSHHLAPNIHEHDSDLQISSLVRVEPIAPYKPWHRLQFLYAPFLYMTYSVFWIFIKDVKLLLRKDQYQTKDWKYVLSFFVQKGIYVGYLIVLPLLLNPQHWQQIVGAMLLMHFVMSEFLLLTFFMTHHIEGMLYPETDNEGKTPITWTDNQIQCSNDFHPYSRFANFIFGGFNNHIAHHLFPAVRSIYYTDICRKIYPILEQEGYQLHRTSWLGGVAAHLKHLYKMGNL